MLTWLYNLIIGNLCHHQWKIIREFDLVSNNPYSIKTKPNVLGKQFIQKCTKCGNIKSTEVY